MKNPEIYCPRCEWRPKPESRWACTPNCGTVWNTFWTGGICPGCAHAWKWTDCLACGVASLHRDWYHFPDEADPADAQAEDTPAHAGA